MPSPRPRSRDETTTLDELAPGVSDRPASAGAEAPATGPADPLLRTITSNSSGSLPALPRRCCVLAGMTVTSPRRTREGPQRLTSGRRVASPQVDDEDILTVKMQGAAVGDRIVALLDHQHPIVVDEGRHADTGLRVEGFAGCAGGSAARVLQFDRDGLQPGASAILQDAGTSGLPDSFGRHPAIRVGAEVDEYPIPSGGERPAGFDGSVRQTKPVVLPRTCSRPSP